MSSQKCKFFGQLSQFGDVSNFLFSVLGIISKVAGAQLTTADLSNIMAPFYKTRKLFNEKPF